MSTAPPEHANVHVLIVDDDALSRDYLRTVLRALQCGEISEAASGANVVQVCARQQANLVFLDIELGGGNGIDLIAPILAERPNTFVVMLSAHSTVDNVKASTRSEEHTSELQSLMRNSYAVFRLKKKTTIVV